MPGKILIVDGISTNRIVLRVKLSAAFYSVVQAGSGAEALRQIDLEQPDLVMTSATLPDMTGTALCQRIKAGEAASCPPVVIVQPNADRADRLMALAQGADEVVSHPLGDTLLLARLRALMRARDSAEELRLRESTSRALGFAEPAADIIAPSRVGLVADTSVKSLLWRKSLAPVTPHRLSCHDGRGLIRDIATRGAPDVLVIGLGGDAPEAGLALLAGLRAQPELRRTMFLAVVEDGNVGLAADALDLGANDLMASGFDAAEMAQRLTTLAHRKALADRLHNTVRDGLRAAVTDPLTELYNRRYALPHLARMTQKAAQTGRPIAVMLADLDHFKQINDLYGHAGGDAVLSEVSHRLRAAMRGIDLLARIGGEEFLIALPDTPPAQARAIARRLCQIISDTPFHLPGHAQPVNVTVSIGLALAHGADIAMDDTAVNGLLDQADRALYGAKAHGRNQVTLSRPAA
ncbi:diguanylate cyclase domain-containing protein [Thalassovita taeanensis]|uniref:diguanylate cyclase n=1 Tax=Thalassovita taeanensis TaxID=657014 RepID=A0A1H9EQ13_9RHOB|nr:diguanylate cyclase [Thalassovita taeanensis]SEQ27677.1 response regulator receiver modulated diguanylate cyclase [Thalassovita taeanensis]